jgi:hypothetical protein
MHQMAVYIKYGGAIFFGVDDVFVPKFVVKRAAHMIFPWQFNILSCKAPRFGTKQNARRCCHRRAF